MYDAEEWNKICTWVVLRGVREEILQNEDARKLLMETGEAVIGEATQVDKFWGTGVGIDEATAADCKNWPGQNEMGKCLMKVRDEMRGHFDF